ncbi:mitochondrial ribonuclease P protein 1 homolog [Cimex lectularius]|uniref:RNA (guanine-9-)-methyltransferase domain-containing protein 1 n=1 Tax=Cimex lectularius TaxID=79782 RepID=A0A8I6TG58_CIMLE|nr:mitochondrial ribonuclease P protein 1 homolog [Cimex lectularius]
MLGFSLRSVVGLVGRNRSIPKNVFKLTISNCINSRGFCTNADVNNYENVDYEGITKGDENLKKNLKVIMLEFELLRQESNKVPSLMTNERWSELLNAKSKRQRIKQINFWWVNEKKKENDKKKKEEKKAKWLATQPEIEENTHIKYGFGGSNIFLRIYESTMDRWNNAKLIEAMMFGQEIIIDCGYDQHMNNREAANCAKQLLILFSENRRHKSPFSLHFVNVDRDGYMMTRFAKQIPILYNDDFPINISTKSYLDMFPKEKLVYLTPHCREELTTYNHDDIYIIGAMVDKENCKPFSLGKAKAEGLRMAKLPLDRYLDWNLGSKSLTLDQVLKIMLDMKVTGNWETSLQHVPKRKLKDDFEPKVHFLKKKFKDESFSEKLLKSRDRKHKTFDIKQVYN